MRVAPTDDTLRPGPLTTAAGTGDNGVPPADPAEQQAATAQRAAHRRALTRELGALIFGIAAVIIAVWSLYAVIGLPALGLGIAAGLAAISRGLAYHKPG